MAPPAGRYQLLKTRLDRLTKMLHGVSEGDVEAIHRARVASRRLRELLPILEMEAGEAGKLGRRLRKVTRRLGDVRELDVLLLLVGELKEDALPARTLARVADEVQVERARARKRFMSKIGPGELRRTARKLGRVARRLEKGDAPGAESRRWRWALDARVARRATVLAQTIERAGALYLPDRLHAVRIAVKKLRYAVELSAEAAGNARSADVRLLTRQQDLLGRLHDYQVLIDRVRRSHTSFPATDVPAWREQDRLVASLENAARRLHARYIRRRAPLAELCDRLAAGAPPPVAVARRAG
jgi:CHAD domain-containing protein